MYPENQKSAGAITPVNSPEPEIDPMILKYMKVVKEQRVFHEVENESVYPTSGKMAASTKPDASLKAFISTHRVCSLSFN